MEFKIDVAAALKGIGEAERKARRAIELYGETAALKLEAQAKQDAPWKDRTGNARQTIKGVSGWGGTTAYIELADTGAWVENEAEVVVSSVSKTDGWDKAHFVIAVTGNMPYSPRLEYDYGGKYAVFWPTINRMAPDILRGAHNLLK